MGARWSRESLESSSRSEAGNLDECWLLRCRCGMPKIRTNRTKPPPEGFEEIEGILDEYARKMRDAESESHEGKRKTEALWPIMRITHTRSRYIFDLYYKREAISKDLYDWLLKQEYADAKYVPPSATALTSSLIAKWKRTGYDKLCCARCVATRDMNYVGSTCICRVPKAHLKNGVIVECTHCGTLPVHRARELTRPLRLSRLRLERLNSL